jgi:outer membrane protein OmpA-like peptidoglycan-associated protein/opacity protein-like surface antigen
MLKNALIFIIILGLAIPAFADDRGEAVAVGARGGVTNYMGDDFDDSVLKPTFSAFGEYYFTNRFSTELGFNVSRIGGETGSADFISDLTGLSLLGRFGLLTTAVRPYLAGGVEVFAFDPEVDNEASVGFNKENEEVTVGIPVGGGLSLAISENMVLDLRGLYHYTFKDGLDYLFGGSKDAYLTGTLGLTKVFHANKDVDNDGLLKSDEKSRGTDPDVADTDGDALNDGDEVLTHYTDPLKVDSDNDGLGDGDEIKKYKTNPLKSDTDGDKLSDKDELSEFKTNPLEQDSDGDGLSDYAEVKRFQTNASEMDSDADGLNDGDEVNKYKTSPLKKDTDGGTVDDAAEVKRGTNPLNKDDDVILEVKEVGAKIVLEGIVFETGSAVISEESAEVLEKAYQTLKAYPEMEVEIQGYTDNVGRKSYNLKLSQKRADSVRDWLVNKGIDGSKITAKGYGPANPIATNDTKEGRAQNRRIEFVRLK